MWRQRNKLKSFNTEISNQKDKIDTLHKELNHRVKNNLAFMTSLLEMQGRRTSSEEAKEIVQDSESRLRALSLVHSHLYDKTESTNINLKTYLQDISNNLEQIFSKPDRRLNINNDIDELEVDAEIAMRIGLVLNELVTNSIKHAFNDHKEAIVNIGSFIGADNKINLKYDDGSEFNLDTFDTSASNSMGAKLIKLIRSQLRQEVVFQFGDVMV
jgi:two-component sensor histidine kinase